MYFLEEKSKLTFSYLISKYLIILIYEINDNKSQSGRFAFERKIINN